MSATSGVLAPSVLLRLAGLVILRPRTLANHARPLAGVVSGRGGRPSLTTIVRSCVMGRAYAGAWAAREAGADALASAARMRGRSSWQVTQLAAGGDAEGAAERVLERVSAAAGRSGAERVFLRLPSECDLLDAARRAGYFPAYYETLMVSRAAGFCAGSLSTVGHSASRSLAAGRVRPVSRIQRGRAVPGAAAGGSHVRPVAGLARARLRAGAGVRAGGRTRARGLPKSRTQRGEWLATGNLGAGGGRCVGNVGRVRDGAAGGCAGGCERRCRSFSRTCCAR